MFVGLAWTSLILGIVGVMLSAVPILNALTMLGAIVGIVLGGIALFGSRKRLAAIGTVSCVLAVVFTVSGPATAANQPVGPAPSLVAPRAPVGPPAALPAPPVPPAPEVSAASPAPSTAARQAVPTSPAERVKTPSERMAVAAQPVAPQRDSDSGAGSVYYQNCAAARAAGVAPIRRGEPGYRSGLDRDADGIACDT